MNENIIAAIAKLNVIVTDIYIDDTCFLDIKDTVEEVIALLKAKDTNVLTTWISVKDRLPDESGEYLVFTKRGYLSVLDYSTRHKEFNAQDTDKKPFHAIEVTHWMPLPEPPKEGEK